MATALNLGSLTVDSSGRAFLSGTGSGIDFSDAVEKIIEAKRQPAISLEAKVTANQAKIEAYKELRSTLNTFRDALAHLRGAITVDGTGDVFKSKSTFTSTFRVDGQSPSAAGNLVGATVTNAAAKGVHEIEVRRVAAAHKVGSQAFASVGTALGIAGEFTIGGRTVTIAATDTLANVRDRINAVNAGSTASGVTASIVSVSAGENYLVLTKDQAGSAMVLSEAGTALDDLGISTDNGATFANQLQAAQTARLTADGLVDPDRFETAVQTSATASLASLFTPTNVNGTFTIGVTSVNYDASTDSLEDIANRINSLVPNVNATVVADGLGFRLDVTTTDPSLSVADTSGLLADLGFNNDLVIERTSNQVKDLFAGVTLSLFQAEAGTKIKIEVEQDLSQAKDAVANFVTAYNAARRLINEHSLADPTTGAKGAESGVLFSDSTLGDIRSRLASAVGSGVAGVSNAFSVLAQVGVTFVDNASVADVLDKNTLKVDDTKLNDALLNNADDVRRLFAFDFASTSSNVAIVDYGANTAFSASGYTLNIGTIGQKNKNSAAVTDADALLNSADSFAATTSGAFNVNGVAVVYDVATETLRTVANRINASVIPGVTATVKTGPDGDFVALASTTGPVTVDGDTGDLLALMNVQPDLSIIDSANIGGTADGADDGSVTINGRTVTVTGESGAAGLKLFYSGDASTSGIGLSFTRGLATDLFFDVDSFVSLTDGALQSSIAALEGENVVADRRVDEIDARLEIQRASLTRRFVAMEVALQALSRIREQLEQYATQLSSGT